MREETTTSYICEKCGSRYTTEEAARSCENKHVGCSTEITKLVYNSRSSIYPNNIVITMGDSTKQEYTWKGQYYGD